MERGKTEIELNYTETRVPENTISCSEEKKVVDHWMGRQVAKSLVTN